MLIYIWKIAEDSDKHWNVFSSFKQFLQNSPMKLSTANSYF